MLGKCVNGLFFLKEFLKNPRRIGAILPSSKWLAKEMVSHVCLTGGIVVELGPGTGIITEALIQSGIDPRNIITIEYSSDLAKRLQKRFPDIQVIEGDASNLIDLLGKKASQVSSVISSLPLRLLPEKKARRIVDQISTLLPVGRKYIQYTYSMKQNFIYRPTRYSQVQSRKVWWNIPPAQVDIFTI